MVISSRQTPYCHWRSAYVKSSRSKTGQKEKGKFEIELSLTSSADEMRHKEAILIIPIWDWLYYNWCKFRFWKTFMWAISTAGAKSHIQLVRHRWAINTSLISYGRYQSGFSEIVRGRLFCRHAEQHFLSLSKWWYYWHQHLLRWTVLPPSKSWPRKSIPDWGDWLKIRRITYQTTRVW